MTQAIKAFLEADALLPCPFCGGEAEKHKYMDRCACDRDTCWMYGRFMSLATWNTRTPDLAKMVEDMRVAIEALEQCYSLFSDIRNDWSDPRSECRQGWSVIDQALARLKPYEKLFEKEGER